MNKDELRKDLVALATKYGFAAFAMLYIVRPDDDSGGGDLAKLKQGIVLADRLNVRAPEGSEVQLRNDLLDHYLQHFAKIGAAFALHEVN
jgi:hypothetical protein